MHPGSGDIPLVTLDGREGTTKRVRRVAEEASRNDWSGLARLQLTWTKVENKNWSLRFLSVFHRLRLDARQHAMLQWLLTTATALNPQVRDQTTRKQNAIATQINTGLLVYFNVPNPECVTNAF